MAYRRHELSQADWAALQPYLPPPASKGRPRKDDRQVLNGILWILGTGAPWRDLPERYGPWKTVYSRYRRWQRAGVWDRILEVLERRMEEERRVDWALFLHDGTRLRARRAPAAVGDIEEAGRAA